MKKFDIEKTSIKLVPFRNSNELEIQIGYLTVNQEKIFRYTRPLNMVNSSYVVTLHYCNDKEHIPYVYSLTHYNSDTDFQVNAMNQDAKNVAQLTGSQMHKELMGAIDCIIKQDIQL